MNHCSGQGIYAILWTVAYVWWFFDRGISKIMLPYFNNECKFHVFFVSGISCRPTDFDHSDTSTSWNIIKVLSLFEFNLGKCKTSAIIYFEFFLHISHTKHPLKICNTIMSVEFFNHISNTYGLLRTWQIPKFHFHLFFHSVDEGQVDWLPEVVIFASVRRIQERCFDQFFHCIK
jgi:hypothetical protein